MTKSLFPLFATMLLAACGSKSTPPTASPTTGGDEEPVTTPPTDAEHGDHADHSGHSMPAPDAAPPAPDPAQMKADLLAAEAAAYEKAKPVFQKYCASCHQKGGKSATAKKMGHFDMTAYPFGGHHVGEMSATIRKVLGIDGSKATMPRDKPGAVKGDELALVAAWADAFDASHTGGAHEGMPGHEDHGAHHSH